MRMKKLLSIGFAVMLLLGMVMAIGNAMKVYPPAPWKIWVIPSYVNGTKVGVGNTFTVDINVTGGDIYGIDYRLSWDDTLLQFVSKVSQNPSVDPEGAWAGGVQQLADKTEDLDGNTLKDTYHWSYLSLGAGPPFNGTMKLATVTLRVIYRPMYIDASCPLDLHSLKVVGYLLGTDITGYFTIYDGLYEINAISPAKPRLYVDPPSIYNASMEPCKNFTVNIKVANATKLYSFDLKLGFNKTLLEVTEAKEGPFLKGFGTTVVNKLEINNIVGYVWINISLVTGGPATGDGILANVTFHVIGVGECVLDLYDTKLADGVGAQIPHDVSDGYFNNVLLAGILVDPPAIIDPTLLPPAKFFINITIGNITNMYDYVFKLGYNTKILNCLSVEILPFKNETNFTSMISINDALGVVYVNVTYFEPALPIETIPAVAFATIKFQVTGLGTSVFDLYDTYLSDPTGASIPHKATDGYLCILIRDVAILSVKPSTNSTFVGWWPVNITVVAANEGDIAETFNVSAYYDNNLIGTQKVIDLPSKKNTTLIFTWNTTGVQPCRNYTIKAVASQVQYETDTADNVKIDGKVKIKMLGDMDGDGDIDIIDIGTAAKAFGSAEKDLPSTPWDDTVNWNPKADLDMNGIVDIFDLVIVARRYEQKCV